MKLYVVVERWEVFQNKFVFYPPSLISDNIVTTIKFIQDSLHELKESKVELNVRFQLYQYELDNDKPSKLIKEFYL